MHTFFENITKDLYKPARTEQISAAIFLSLSSTLNTEYIPFSSNKI
jgi:hypothetical protein